MKAHNKEILNELADDLAKIGMINYLKVKNWKNHEINFGLNEWHNMSFSAIKNQNKRQALKNTQKDWNNYKKHKIKNDSLPINLKKWDIKYNYKIKFEMNELNMNEWKCINSFRCGHNELGMHCKFGNNDKICQSINCNENETIEHFILNVLKCLKK